MKDVIYDGDYWIDVDETPIQAPEEKKPRRKLEL